MQEEDVIGVLPSGDKISTMKPLGDRVLIKVRRPAAQCVGCNWHSSSWFEWGWQTQCWVVMLCLCYGAVQGKFDFGGCLCTASSRCC